MSTLPLVSYIRVEIKEVIFNEIIEKVCLGTFHSLIRDYVLYSSVKSSGNISLMQSNFHKK